MSFSKGMVGWRGIVLAAAVAAGGEMPSLGQEAIVPPGQKPADVWEPKVLEIDPATEVSPALKYRLVPASSELTPGDAAPAYLRVRYEMRDEVVQPMYRDAAAWLELPFETFPLDDARRLVDLFRVRLGMIDLAARRASCDWGYPLIEQRRDIINILLPDAQELRGWARLVSLKARVEIRNGRFDEAARTLQTGFAMGRHLAAGPFLINGLVGMAVCNSMLDRVEEFVSQSEAPNLYWALSVVPVPAVSLRDAYEMEQRMGENLVPALAELDGDHTPEEWDVVLASMYRDLMTLGRKLLGEGENDATLGTALALDLDAYRARFASEAREWAKANRGLSDAEATALPESRVLAEHLVARYRRMRDAAFRASYLPYAQARTLRERQDAELAAEKDGPVAVLACVMPSISAAGRSALRLDRRVAALRVVEAIRMHAAAHGGKLPGTLDEIDAVPVPVDPATGLPFAYVVDEEGASLSAGRIDTYPKTEIAYRIRLR